MAETAREDTQEFVVDEPLAQWLERRGMRGVHAGDRVRLQLIQGEGSDEPLPAYFGSFHSGEGDLSERVDEIVRPHLRASDAH